jgi:hypothetical protein
LGIRVRASRSTGVTQQAKAEARAEARKASENFSLFAAEAAVKIQNLFKICASGRHVLEIICDSGDAAPY